MKSSDSKTPLGKGRASETARDRLHRKLDDAVEKAERLTEAMGRLQDAYDHVDQAMLQWQREMPEVEIRGADVLNRARRIVLESRPAIEANFRRHGLDTGEFDVLASLRRSGAPYELRPTELYRTLMISSGGLTARLDRLEGQGLIRRRPAGDDARSWIVELTPAGKKKIEAAFRADMEIENRMVEGLSEKERTDLIRLLRKLTQAMKGVTE
jgi:DNA-binding MarR family transcriptional regulator